MVCCGEAGGLLEEALASAAGETAAELPIERVETLEEALVTARGYAHRGDVVLVSPACAS